MGPLSSDASTIVVSQLPMLIQIRSICLGGKYAGISEKLFTEDPQGWLVV